MVKDGTVLVMDEVGADYFIGSPVEDALHISLAGLFHGGADFLVAGFLLGFDGEVNDGDGWGGDAEGHAGELAFDFGDGETDGLGGTGAAGDDVDGSAAATFPILGAWAVHGFLRGGVAVDGGHEAFRDAESFFEEDVNHGCEAVGGAGSVGDDVVSGGVIFLVVDAHDDGDVLFFAWGGDDDFLGAGVDVTLGFAALSEETGGFDDNVDAEFLPREGGRAGTDGEAFDFVTVDDEDVIFGEVGAGFFGVDFLLGFALGGVVFDEVSEVVRWDEVVDSDDFNFLAQETLVTNCAKHEAADAPETINADLDHCISE